MIEEKGYERVSRNDIMDRVKKMMSNDIIAKLDAEFERLTAETREKNAYMAEVLELASEVRNMPAHHSALGKTVFRLEITPPSLPILLTDSTCSDCRTWY